MIRLGFVIPGSLDSPTGGTRYDREVMARLDPCKIKVMPLLLAGSYPFPSDRERRETALNLERATVDLFLIDGLAFGAFSDEELAALKKPVIVLLHHPLADETGLTADVAADLYRRERSNLKKACAVIVTSQTTKDNLITDYAVKADDIIVAEPGVTKPLNVQQRAGLKGERPVKLLSVGAISPRKNYGLVLDALALLPSEIDWIWTIAGRLNDQEETERLANKAQDMGLKHRINWLGAISDAHLASLYQDSDFLLFPSLYEGYGMALDEALAYGLPVLASDHIPSARRNAPAVRCLDPSMPHLWSEAIAQWVKKPASFNSAAQSAILLAKSLPDWDHPTRQITTKIVSVFGKG
jgi:glycosyltransferase involved in cell wall biosynthesis